EELFDTIVSIENYPLDMGTISGGSTLSVNSYSMSEETHYDLSLEITFFDELTCTFTYKKAVLDDDDIRRLAGHFNNILENIVENPVKRIRQLEMLSGEEKRQLLTGFNNTPVAYPPDRLIHELFQRRAKKNPHGTAVIGMAHITYNRLNRKSHQLANTLRNSGVKPGTIVA
ncbi:MAG: hypothetical protein GY940_23725, partial [bacterium]|nr:hypothetical protein [bacterium]